MTTITPLGTLPFPLAKRPDAAPHVCVVVPVYNEERSVEALCDRLGEALGPLDATWSVLFVNDGSSDQTMARLEELHGADEHVSYILLSRNFGHQAALCAGLDHADGDVFVTMDMNLQYQQHLEGSGIAVVVLECRSNRFEDLLPLVPQLIEVLTNPLTSGKVVRVGR